MTVQPLGKEGAENSFFFTLSGAWCEIVPALQTHGLRQYITVPCHLPAILTELRIPNFGKEGMLSCRGGGGGLVRE